MIAEFSSSLSSFGILSVVIPISSNFNPLIPHREIQQYCTKICHYIFTVLPKIICFPCLLFQKSSNFLILTEKNNLLSGANPPYISCELLVRTIIMLSINTYYFQERQKHSFFRILSKFCFFLLRYLTMILIRLFPYYAVWAMSDTLTN